MRHRAFAVLAAAALAAPARADLYNTNYIDADNFSFRISHMPDVDQLR